MVLYVWLQQYDPTLPQFLVAKSIVIVVNQVIIEIYLRLKNYRTADGVRTRSSRVKILRLYQFGLSSITLLSLLGFSIGAFNFHGIKIHKVEI